MNVYRFIIVTIHFTLQVLFLKFDSDKCLENATACLQENINQIDSSSKPSKKIRELKCPSRCNGGHANSSDTRMKPSTASFVVINLTEKNPFSYKRKVTSPKTSTEMI